MIQQVDQTRFGRAWFGKSSALVLGVVLVGCAPDGAGSIELDDPSAVRARAEGPGASAKAAAGKPAASPKGEEEAAKKNPKLY